VNIERVPVLGVGDFFGVPQPFGRNVTWIFFRQFGRPRRAKILKRARPRLDARPQKDSLKLSPQIAIGRAVFGDNVLRSFHRLAVHVHQGFAEFRKHRHQPCFVPELN
jgi:hypothetical protein